MSRWSQVARTESTQTKFSISISSTNKGIFLYSSINGLDKPYVFD
jgi:hypothetical protein